MRHLKRTSLITCFTITFSIKIIIDPIIKLELCPSLRDI